MKMATECRRAEWRLHLLARQVVFRVERDFVEVQHTVYEALDIAKKSIGRNTVDPVVAYMNVLATKFDDVLPVRPSSGVRKLIDILSLRINVAIRGQSD